MADTGTSCSQYIGDDNTFIRNKHDIVMHEHLIEVGDSVINGV